MEKTDQKLIKIVLENPQYLKYIILRNITNRKYTIDEYPITNTIFKNKYFLRVIFIILMTIYL